MVRRIAKTAWAQAAGFVAALVVVWYAFTGIGPWGGLNESAGASGCVRAGTNPDGSEQWRCERGETPSRVTYDRKTDSYLIRACTLVRSGSGRGRGRSDVYSCREEVG